MVTALVSGLPPSSSGKGARKVIDSEFAGRNSAVRIRTEGKGGLKWLNGNTEFNESSFDLM